jgi:hypothetical protein
MVFARHRLILLIGARPLQCIRAQKAWKTQLTILPSGSFLGPVHPRHFKTHLYPVIPYGSGLGVRCSITPYRNFETSPPQSPHLALLFRAGTAPEERAAKRCRTSSPTRATIHLEHRGGHFYWIPSHQQWPPRQSKSHFPWRLQGKVTGGRRPQSIICRSGIMVTTFKHQRLERLHPASLLHYAQVAISNGSLEIIDQVKLCLDTWGDSLSRTHCWPCWLSIKQPFGVLKRLWWINLGHDPHSGTPVLAPMKLIHSSHLSYIWCLPYGPQFMRWNERIQY